MTVKHLFGELDALELEQLEVLLHVLVERHLNLPGLREQLGVLDGRFVVDVVGVGQRETLEPGRIGTLKSSLLHFNFSKGLCDWIEKHNRYSTAEARQNVYGYADDDFSIPDLLSIATDRRRRAAKKICLP